MKKTKNISSLLLLTSVSLVMPLVVSCSKNSPNNDNKKIIDWALVENNVINEIKNKTIKIDDTNDKKNIEKLLNDQIINKLNNSSNDYSIQLSSFNVNEKTNEIELTLKASNKSDNLDFKEIKTNLKYNVISSGLSYKDQSTFNWGDPKIYALDSVVTNDYLKKLIIKNKNEIFNNATNFDDSFFEKNITINRARKDNGEGFVSIQFSIVQNDKTLKNNICIQGFKQYEESLIQPPTISNEDFCTQAEFNNEVKFLNDIPIGMRQYYFTQEQLDNLGEDDIFYDLIDIRTNKAPYFSYESRPFDINVESFQIDKQNNKINVNFTIEGFEKNSNNFNATFSKEIPIEIYSLNDDQKNDLLERVVKKLEIKETNQKHDQIKAKNFQRYDLNEIKKYLMLNEEEINKVFWNEPGYDDVYKTFTIDQNPYDFKNPTYLNFKVETNFKGTSLNKVKTQKIDGFKNVITQEKLDLNPIVKLPTPVGSVSYKGKLEKFYFDEFVTTNEVNYKDVLKKTTNEEIKLEMMYQIRFSLYQMFGDNFTEINYYISNEKNANGEFSFVAVGEGIIDKEMKDRFYGFQNTIGTPGFSAKSDLNSGDKVKIELVFDTFRSSNNTHIEPKPTFLERGQWGFSYTWFWNYDNNCDNLKNYGGTIKDDVPRNNWSSVQYNKVYINNVPKINQKINQWNFPWLSKQFIIPK